MYTFKVLQANSEENGDLLDSMHHLRWVIFHKKLKWSVGLRIDEAKETESDEYDTEGTFYIVRINSHNEVDGTCRLRPTSKPYMLAEHYSDFIENEPVPHTDEVWEISRTCAHPEAARSTDGRTTAQLITAAVEFGLARGIKNYISLTTDKLYPMLRGRVGWDPQFLGDKHQTPDDFSYALKYTVSYKMLQHLRAKNGIDKPLLYEFDETLNNPKELWHDNLIIPETAETRFTLSKPEGFSGWSFVSTFIFRGHLV